MARNSGRQIQQRRKCQVTTSIWQELFCVWGAKYPFWGSSFTKKKKSLETEVQEENLEQEQQVKDD
jgi:hypothetical protein